MRKATKRGKTCIITGSPYTTALEAKGKMVTCPQPSSSSSKKRGHPKANKTSKKNKKTKEDSGTTPCLNCSELYSSNKRGKSSVQCSVGSVASGHTVSMPGRSVAGLCATFFASTIKWHRTYLRGAHFSRHILFNKKWVSF